MATELIAFPLYNFGEVATPLPLRGAAILREGQAIIKVPSVEYYLQLEARAGEPARRSMDRALAVLRFFKEGDVWSDALMATQRGPDLLPHYQFHTGKSGPPTLYQVSPEEATELVRFWDRAIDVMDPGSFPVVRFNHSYTSPYMPDRYVDYVSSLEYLLVPDGRSGELRYKFSSRGAVLLSATSSPDERRNIYERLKRAYDLRSEIVHGAERKLLPKEDGWLPLLQEIRGFLRTVIRFYIQEDLLAASDKVRTPRVLEKSLFGA